MDETGTDEAAAAHAFVLADAVFGFGRLTAEIDAATALPAETAAAAHHRIRTALVTAANWAIRNVAAATPLADAITRFAAPVADLSASIETILSADAAEHRRGETARLAGMGLPEPAARALALLGDVIELTDIRLVAEATGAEPASTARLFFAAAERLGLDSLHRVATRAVIADRYDAQVLQRAIGMVDDAHRSAAAAALSRPDGLEGWLAERETALARLKSAVDEIALAPHPSVSAVSVAAGLLSDIVRT
jgi:NAD-specific glutamate dehydrogenase